MSNEMNTVQAKKGNFKENLGIFRRASYYTPIAMISAGIIAVAFQDTGLDAASSLIGALLGGGFVGLLYRMTYNLTPKKQNSSEE
jgi:predicted membrane channel-forming protein YqfA (hemolysin III family)